MNLFFGSLGRAMIAAICIVALPGCAETVLGAHLVKSAARTADSARSPAGAPPADARPDAFAATGLTIWDGAETPEGVWIAHPRAKRAQQVGIRDTESGREVAGALFPRDDEAPGPSILISADAARALNMTPGAPARISIAAAAPRAVAAMEIRVSALAPVAVPARGPVVDAPLKTETSPPRASAPRSRAPAPRPGSNALAYGPIALGAHAPEPRARPIRATTPDAAPDPGGAYLQAGAFRVGANAAGLVERLRARGQPAHQIRRPAGADEVEIVLIGPLPDEALPAARAAVEAEGLADAIEVKP